jgi:hypothetical protein
MTEYAYNSDDEDNDPFANMDTGTNPGRFCFFFPLGIFGVEMEVGSCGLLCVLWRCADFDWTPDAFIIYCREKERHPAGGFR